MSYEQYCNDYALHGNPERDAMEYEEAARYDQYDGYREDFYDQYEDDFEPFCQHVTDFHYHQHVEAEKLRAAMRDSFSDNVPF